MVEVSDLAVLGFFLAVIVTVFWQIETDFKEQGIAGGGPYDNAASFPRTIAIFVGLFVTLQLASDLLAGKAHNVRNMPRHRALAVPA